MPGGVKENPSRGREVSNLNIKVNAVGWRAGWGVEPECCSFIMSRPGGLHSANSLCCSLHFLFVALRYPPSGLTHPFFFFSFFFGDVRKVLAAHMVRHLKWKHTLNRKR